MQESREENEYEIVIIECCENCESHQSYSRHSEWKYFEQFNELKKKIEKFVPNAIVIKNPIPDELVKPTDAKLDKNVYLNVETNEKVVFPRIGAFEIYIYNVLISSKLKSNVWPNHYKILQVLNQIIESKRNGLSLESFSVYNQYAAQDLPRDSSIVASNSPKNSPERKVRVYSKKKKVQGSINNAYRVYRSKQKSIIDPKRLEPLKEKEKIQKLSAILANSNTIESSPNRYSESKQQNRIKLPSLKNTINLENNNETSNENSRPQFRDSLDEREMSIIERRDSVEMEKNQFDSLILNNENESIDRGRNQSIIDEEQMKFLENRSVQYSQRVLEKDIMNRSVQYEEEEGYHLDFGLQIDELSMPKEISFQFVQTEQVEFQEESSKRKVKAKPYLLDESVQANIIIKKKEKTQEIQTLTIPSAEQQTNTEKAVLVNRGYQHPEQNSSQKVEKYKIDDNFTHLYEKRRNFLDGSSYSIDRFEQKLTKYKWTGRTYESNSVVVGEEDIEKLKEKVFLQALVLAVYNHFGVKSPEKRLSFQQCTNVQGDKVTRKAAPHIMTADNPELQYLFQFEELDTESQRYPISELLTFRTSKQSVKFSNWGKFLALCYFLEDTEVFDGKTQIGLVISNEEVKEIHKLSGLNYQLFGAFEGSENMASRHRGDHVFVDSHQNSIAIDRLSKDLELQFISMLSRITMSSNFQELMLFIREIFVAKSKAYQKYSKTLESLQISSSAEEKYSQSVQAFLKKLEARKAFILENFKGKIYTYRKYSSLEANIKFELLPQPYIERQMRLEDRRVNKSELIKHIRSRDNFVVLMGPYGSGKTTLLLEIYKELKSIERYNIVLINQSRNQMPTKDFNLKYGNQLKENSKNVVLVDGIHSQANSALSVQRITDFVDYAHSKLSKEELSFFVTTHNPQTINQLKVRVNSSKIVGIEMLDLEPEEIRRYISKAIDTKNLTQKQEVADRVIGSLHRATALKIPFYLNLYCRHTLDPETVQNFTFQPWKATKYHILKKTFEMCSDQHREECEKMDIQHKNPYYELRLLSLKVFHKTQNEEDIIREFFFKFEEESILRSQLQFYPIQTKCLLDGANLFTHAEFFHFMVVEAYSYYIEKGYRNLLTQKLYENSHLLEMVKQKYECEQTYENLLEVVYESQKFPNTSEQASNAITLLSQIGYSFSNLVLDHCQIPDADLSLSSFYSCSFRNANLERAILYRCQLNNCVMENTSMENINLFVKKYEIQFTALSCSLSADGKYIALGCGNYLIILNAETGKEIKKIEAHLDVIKTVKYTRDGKNLITIADDKTLRTWDTQSFRSVVFKLPQKGSITFSNETETIASVSKSNLKVWNIKSMANECLCEGHTDLITTVFFTVDGQNILTGSRDTTLRLWNLKGLQLHAYKAHDGQILTGKVTANSHTMVSSSKRKDLIIWQKQTEKKIVSRTFSNEVVQVCIDPQQRYVLTAFSHEVDIHVLKFHDLEIQHVLKGHNNRILSMDFDTEYRKFISLSKDRTVRLWQIEKIMESQGKMKQRSPDIIAQGPIVSVAYDSRNKQYATGHENGEINIWESATDRLLDQLYDHSGKVRKMVFDKQGKLYSGGDDGILRIWDLNKRREPRKIELFSVELIELKINEKNRIIVTSSINNELVIYDFTGIKLILSTRDEGKINSVAFSNNDKLLAIGGMEKYIVMYQIESGGNSVSRIEELGEHPEPINCLVFQGESLLICALKNGHIYIWNHLRSSIVKKIENISPIFELKVLQKKYACFSCDDGKIRIIDMDVGREVKVFRYWEKTNSFVCNEDESLVYAGSKDGNLIKWNINSMKNSAKSKVKFGRKAINEDCSKMVTIESGHSLKLLNLFDHNEELHRVDCPEPIEGVNFERDKVILLLKSGRFWQMGKKGYQIEVNNFFEGDLFYSKNKETCFFRSGLKKLKYIKKPTNSVVEELSTN